MAEEDLRLDATVRFEINLYYDVFVPENHVAPAPLLIAVHGYGGNKRSMMREARLVASANCVIASLQGPHQHFRNTEEGNRTGFGWLTDHRPAESIRLHHKFVIDVIERLRREKLIDLSKIFMYGFSQASALDFRFAFSHPKVLKGIIAVSGGIPSDLETNPDYVPFDAETFYLYGDSDEYYSTEKFADSDRRLKERLPNYRSKKYSARHEITDAMRADIRTFLADLTK